MPSPADSEFRAPGPGSCPRPRRPVDASHTSGMDTVVVQFVLDTTGHAINRTIQVVRSTDPHLNPAARLSAWGCHYAAARKDGHPIPVIVQVPFFF
ncbi:MAG: energy transducer TonB [Gemmatimonadota bacterium]